MSDDCIFCKIVDGQIPAKIEYQDEDILVFHDVTPQAPLHLLIIPKQHIANINEIREENAAIISKIFTQIPKLAFHLHFHMLAGRHLTWPPG